MVSSLCGSCSSIVVGMVEFSDASALYNVIKDDLVILSYLPVKEQEIIEAKQLWMENDKTKKKEFCKTLFRRLLEIQDRSFNSSEKSLPEDCVQVPKDEIKNPVPSTEKHARDSEPFSKTTWRNRSLSALNQKPEAEVNQANKLSQSQKSVPTYDVSELIFQMDEFLDTP